MNNLTFGFTMLVVGMGGTLITLWLLTMLIRAITSLLPPPRNSAGEPKS